MTIGTDPTANLHLNQSQLDSQNISIGEKEPSSIDQSQQTGQTVGLSKSDASKLQEANFKFLQANDINGPVLNEFSKLMDSFIGMHDLGKELNREVQNYNDYVIVMKAELFTNPENMDLTEIVYPPGTQLEETQLPEEMNQAVQDVLDLSKNTTTEACKANIEKLEAQIDKLDPNSSSFTALQSFSGQVLNYASNRLLSLGTMESFKAEIQEQRAELPNDASIKERMQAFSEHRTEWNKIAFAQRESADATQPNEAIASKGNYLMPDQAQECRNMLCEEGAAIVKSLIPEDSPLRGVLSDKACGMIAAFSLEFGTPLNEATELICKALSGMQSMVGENDLGSVEKLLNDILNAKTPVEKNQSVDALFSHTYPENTDAALALKQSLCEYKADNESVTQLHNYSMSMHTLTRLLGDESSINSSTLLTPESAKELLKKTDIDNFKFHLAHIAMLQAECIADGTIELPLETNKQGQLVIAGVGITKEQFDAMPPTPKQEFLRAFADLQLNNWSETLELDDYVQNFKDSLGKGSPDYLDKLNTAVELYNKGLEGTTQFQQVEKNIQSTASISKRTGAHSFERGMLRTNTRSVAMEALDRHIQHVTGESDPNKRIYGAESMQKNGEHIDKLMQDKVKKLLDVNDLKKTALVQGNNEELQKLNDYRDESMKELKGCRRNFLSHVKNLGKMAQQTEERMELRSKQGATELHSKEMKKVYNQIASALPHQKADRTAVCRTVREIESYGNALSKVESQLKNDPTNEKLLAQKASLESRIAESLKQLKGVDIHTMRHTLKKADAEKTPTLDDVMREMAPRADAVLYFVDGRAKIDSKQISHMKDRIKADTKSIDQINKKTKNIYGKTTLSELKNVVNTAILKVAATVQGPIEKLNIYDKATQTKIREQLKSWGIDAKEGSFIDHLMSENLLKVSTKTGRLNPKALKDLLKVKTETAEVTEAVNMETARYLQEHNLDLEQFDTVHYKVIEQHNEARYDLRRQEGVHNLISDIKNPGDGFTYSMQNGAAIPINPLDKIFEKIGAPGLFNVKFSRLRDDSIAVTKGQDGQFQVFMKTDKAKSVLVKGGLQLSAGKLKLLNLTGTSSKEFSEAKGVSLTFPDQKSCEQFMNDVLNPKSDTHKTGTTEHSWRDSVDIQLHTGSQEKVESNNHIGALLTKNGLLTMLQDDSRKTNSVSTTQNAHGTETRYSESYVASTKFDIFGKVNTNYEKPIQINTNLFVRENENGLSPNTSFTFSFAKSDLLLKEALMMCNLNSSQIALLESDPKQMKAMTEAWHKLSKNDNMTIRYEINPSALEKCKQLRTQMNIVSKGGNDNAIDKRSLEELKAEYKSIIKDPANYHAKEMKMTSTPKPDYTGGKDLSVIRRTVNLSHTTSATFQIPTM